MNLQRVHIGDVVHVTYKGRDTDATVVEKITTGLIIEPHSPVFSWRHVTARHVHKIVRRAPRLGQVTTMKGYIT